jgi:2,3-bisphosphoglycerate-independent phosphoglycerate mutase
MKPVVLCILDGVGISSKTEHNAVRMANMPFFNMLLKKFPHTKLAASGAAVGLPPGTMGNSEVGHITLGSGRIVNQFLRRFQILVEQDGLESRMSDFINSMKKSDGYVHVLGLSSDGKVHSDLNDAIAATKIILDRNLKVCWHFIADGRDTPPRSALKYANKISRAFIKEIKSGQLKFCSVSGRYYAMDRDKNWERTDLAFQTIVHAKSKFKADNIKDAIDAAYRRGENDEFIMPTVITPIPISPEDGVLFFDYRVDRARQILRSLTLPSFSEFSRGSYSSPHILCFSQYGEGLNEYCPALLPDVPIANTLGDILAENKKSQLRIAETEKYNHVTYYFDAERVIDYPNEKKILIPSPKVATYDLKPEMSAIEITDALLPELFNFDVVILNYANGDMIGHTGIEKVAKEAMEILDAQLARVVPRVLELGGTILITSDHGNAEKMWNEKLDVPWTAHTTSFVPFIIVGHEKDVKLRSGGGLSDVAPTILSLLNIPQPSEMTGKSLIKNNS